jgi:hypothetical protein
VGFIITEGVRVALLFIVLVALGLGGLLSVGISVLKKRWKQAPSRNFLQRGPPDR